MKALTRTTKILVLCAVLICAFVALWVVPPRRAEGKIKKMDVDGSSYTLTVVLDDGTELQADFPGGRIDLADRCELQRSNLFARWEFVRSFPAPAH